MDRFLQEVPKERMVVGYRQTVRGIRAGQIRCVLIARDADDLIANTLQKLCSDKKIPVRFVSDKKEMGVLLQLDVACAVCGEAVGSTKF